MIKRNQTRNMRKGMTIVETGFAIVIGLVVIVGAIAGYKKMYIPMKGDAAFSKESSVINALERTKMSNSGVYPAASTAKLSTISMIQNELGGASNSVDVADWTYGCSAGSGKTITLTSTPYDDPTVAAIASQKINSSLSPWTASVSGNTVTAKLANVTCN